MEKIDEQRRKAGKIMLATAGALIFSPTKLVEELVEKSQRELSKYENTKKDILVSTSPKSSKYNNNPEIIRHPREYCTLPEINSYINNAMRDISLPDYINRNLIRKITWHESKFNPNAQKITKYRNGKIRSDARGLMQLTLPAWEQVGINKDFEIWAYDPQTNMTAGTAFTNWLDVYGQKNNPDWTRLSSLEKAKIVVAAFNAGPTFLKEVNWEIERTPRETRKYLEKII